jgi:phenylalanyl-tRNA synthetase beta chain
MICAEDELSIGTSHDGIMVLDDSIPAGTPLAEVVGLESDFVFEIGLTPNRTDAMGHIGVARDLRAAMVVKGYEVKELVMPYGSVKTEGSNPIQLSIQDSGCPAYNGAYISDVEVKESPEWLQNSLKAIGLTPKNNVVDITNYVLHTYGHPLHAFDADQLEGNSVIIRPAEAGERITALDEVEHVLTPEDMVIADAKKPACIAGVMGGLISGVTTKTKNVYLEGAYFDAVRIRKTAKRFGISSDASYRYERGVDPNATREAHQYALSLICELTGGKASEVDRQGTEEFPCNEITFSFERVMKLIGLELSPEKVDQILRLLDFKILVMNGDTWKVSVPTNRVDVTRDVDVAEEILRIYGFNEVPVPDQMRISVAKHDPRPGKIEQNTLGQLTGNGFFEIMNNSLTRGADYDSLAPEVVPQLIEMLNPLSQDLNVMRANLLFGGLNVIAFNQKRQNPNLRFFERGKVYGKGANGYFENSCLDLFIAGNEGEHHWRTSATQNDLFELKGFVEAMLNSLGIKYTFNTADHSLYGEYMEIKARKTSLGHIGYVHPKVSKHFDVKGGIAHASLNWEVLTNLVVSAGTQLFNALPKFPSVRRDLALLVDTATGYGDIEMVISQTGGSLLKNCFLFDVYEGDKLPAGKKSYAVGMIIQDDEKTLNDKAVDKLVGRILQQLEHRTGAVLRA